MSILNPLKSGYYFVLFNISNFDCTVIKLLTIANYQNYHFYFAFKYIYNCCIIFLLLFFVNSITNYTGKQYS